MGIIAEYDFFKTSGVSGSVNGLKTIGIAFGMGEAGFLTEIAAEADPLSFLIKSPGMENVSMPLKLSFLIESKLSKFCIGYKVMAFKGNFVDPDRIIKTLLVYDNDATETRLEHVLNFSLGAETGLNFGASASYSKTNTKEKSSLFASTNKHDTDVREISFSAKASYSY